MVAHNFHMLPRRLWISANTADQLDICTRKGVINYAKFNMILSCCRLTINAFTFLQPYEAQSIVCFLSMSPELRRARTCIEPDMNKRPDNPCAMLRTCLGSRSLRPGRDPGIPCNRTQLSKSRLFRVRAMSLHLKLFVLHLFRSSRHYSQSCPECLAMGYRSSTPGTTPQSQTPTRSTSRFSSLKLPSLLL